MAIRDWHVGQLIIFAIAVCVAAFAVGAGASAIRGSHTQFVQVPCDGSDLVYSSFGYSRYAYYCSQTSPHTKTLPQSVHRPFEDSTKGLLRMVALSAPPLLILPVAWIWFGARPRRRRGEEID